MKRMQKFVNVIVTISMIIVLSTVAIVGYNAYIKKTIKSIDKHLCNQYNNILFSESEYDNDITLFEFVNLIEEYNVRDDMFETNNKTYLFAYDRANAKTVLLNKDSGKIVYPEKYDSSKSELWTVLNNERKLAKGISNYAILGTTVLENGDNLDLNDSGLENITIDLCGSALEVTNKDNFNGVNVTIKNGTLVKMSSDINVIAEDNADVIDASIDNTWGKIFTVSDGADVRLELDKFAVIENGKWILKNKYFASTNKAVLSFNGDEFDEIIIKDCIIENICIETSQANARYTIKNNKFINIGEKNTSVMTLQRNYGENEINTYEDFINFNSKFSYEIMDNKFIGCYRGLNLSLPASGISTSRILNNSFDMINVISSNDEVKSYCIQFSSGLSKNNKISSGVIDKVNESPAKAFGKIEINFNKVINARGLISVHSSLSAFYNDSAYNNNVNFLPILEAILTVQDNNILGCFDGLAYADPDKNLDLNTQEKIDNLNAIVEAINANAK